MNTYTGACVKQHDVTGTLTRSQCSEVKWSSRRDVILTSTRCLLWVDQRQALVLFHFLLFTAFYLTKALLVDVQVTVCVM